MGPSASSLRPTQAQRAFGDRLLDSSLDPLARLHVLGDDDDLGERLVGQLRAEPQPEAWRTLADVGRVGRDVLVVL